MQSRRLLGCPTASGRGPQRFSCTAADCSSRAYSYAEYHRLRIEFSNGVTRQSNIFRSRYSSHYLVTVKAAELSVAPKWRPPWSSSGDSGFGYGADSYYSLYYAVVVIGCSIPSILLPAIFLLLIAVRGAGFRRSWAAYVAAWLVCVPALLIYAISSEREGLLATLAIELPLAVGYIFWRKRSAVFLMTVVVMMNIITYTLLMLGMGAIFDLTVPHLLWILVWEFIVWAIEAAILAFSLRKQARLGEAFLLSLVLNGASFGIGILLPV